MNQAPEITLGSMVDGTLTPGIETDIYRFTGTKGQRLQFDSLLAGGNAAWRLYGPNNQTISSSNFIGTDFATTLPTDGEYYLLLDGNSSTGNVSYSFQVNDISDPPPPSTTPFPFIGSGMLSGSPDDLIFTAAAGKLLYFDSLIQNPGYSVQILDPDNAVIYTSSGGSDSVNSILLPRSGDYTVRISGSGSYNFRLLDLEANATALSFGTPTPETLSPSSSARLFSFTGAVGQRLFYDSLDSDFDSVASSLIGPSGNQVISFGNSNSDSTVFTLEEAGTYYLIQSGQSSSTADFSFQLIDAGNAPAIALDTVVNGTLVPGRESDFYRFTAIAGQRLVFDAISGSGANFRVFDAGNTQIDAGGINFDNEFTLPEASTYLLEIEGNSTTDVNYSFQLVTPTTTNTALTLSSPVSGTISELGEKDTYTFSGTAGQRLFYDSRANNTNSLIGTLFSPSGAQVDSRINTDIDGSLVTLTESGAYQLIVESSVSSSNSTGDYDFQLIDAGNAPAIALDTVVNGTLVPGRESDFYRFTAIAGQRLVFDAISGSGANFRVFDAGNTQIDAGGINFDNEFTLPRSWHLSAGNRRQQHHGCQLQLPTGHANHDQHCVDPEQSGFRNDQ